MDRLLSQCFPTLAEGESREPAVPQEPWLLLNCLQMAAMGSEKFGLDVLAPKVQIQGAPEPQKTQTRVERGKIFFVLK